MGKNFSRKDARHSGATSFVNFPMRIVVAMGSLVISGILFYYEIFLRYLTVRSFTVIVGPLSNPESLALNCSVNTAMLLSAIFLLLSVLTATFLFLFRPKKRFAYLYNVGVCLFVYVVVKVGSFFILSSLAYG